MKRTRCSAWLSCNRIPLLLSFLLPFSTAFLARRLHEGIELSVPVSPQTESRVELDYVEGDVFLSISPCSLVHWKLFRLLPGEEEWSGSHVGSEGMEKAVAGDSATLELVAGEEGDNRMSFFSNKLQGERLLLILSSPSASSVHLLQTSSQSALDDSYPPLPADRHLAVAISHNDSDESHSALLTWKIAPAILESASRDPSRYRFCAVLSRRQPKASILCEELDEGLLSIHCVNQTTNHLLIHDIRKRDGDYLSLFVRDSRQGHVSVYDGFHVIADSQSAETGVKKVAEKDAEKESEGAPLVEGDLISASVHGPRGNTLSFVFTANDTASSRRALLVVHACDGYVRVCVSRRGRLLKRSDAFTGFRRFLILNAATGEPIRIEIINDDQKTNDVRLWIGSRADEAPYPLLPDDTSVKVVRRGCDWATLQWLRAADAHAEYCVFQRRETANLLEQLVSRVDSLCGASTMARSSLVGCYSHRGSSSPDVMGLIETTIRQLQPDSTFRFDLLARPLNRTHAQALPYRTVWVRTAASC